jgi:methionyl-tRNA formyltransferase
MTHALPGSLLLLMPQEFGDDLGRTALRLGFEPVACVNTREALAGVFATRSPGVLLAFSTGVIVPAEILARQNLVAVNVHGGGPAYPGRDPHHFASYDGATSFGATLHYMARQVDQGPVIRISTEAVPARAAPAELMAVGVRHGLELARWFLQAFAAAGAPNADPALRWTGPVRRRSDFLALCRISPDISREEFERRLRATAMPGRANLTLELHGRTFRIEPR